MKRTSMPGTLAISSTCVWSAPSQPSGQSTYVLERLLRLDLNDSQQRIVRLLQVLEPGDSARRAHGKRTPESSTANGRELGRLDQSAGIIRRVKQRDDNAVSARVQSP